MVAAKSPQLKLFILPLSLLPLIPGPPALLTGIRLSPGDSYVPMHF